jgi:hypothetical protein
MGRSAWTNQLGREITQQWSRFEGTKLEFMKQLEGVTADVKVEDVEENDTFPAHTSYYCTLLRTHGRLVECYSQDNGDWYCKH